MRWVVLVLGIVILVGGAFAIAARVDGGWRALWERGFEPEPGRFPTHVLFVGALLGAGLLVLVVDPMRSGGATSADLPPLLAGVVSTSAAYLLRRRRRRE